MKSSNVNNASGIKPGDGALSLLSSLKAALNGEDGSNAESLFSDLLNQIKSMPVPQNPPPQPQTTQQQNNNSGNQNNQQAQNNNNNADAAVSNPPPRSTVQTSPAPTRPAGKHRQAAKTDSTKNSSGNQQAQSTTNNNNAPPTNTPAVPANTTANTTPDNSSDPNASTDPTNAATAAGTPTDPNPDPSQYPTTQNTDPTSQNTNPAPQTPAQLLASLAASLASNAPTTPDNGNDSQSTDTTTGSGDNMQAELVQLLKQLEQLAAQQLNALNQTAVTADAGTAQDATAATQTSTTNGSNAAPSSTDLKAFLAALANINAPGINDNNAGQDTDGGNDAGSANTPATPVVTVTPNDNLPKAPAANTPKTDWSSDFLALFNANAQPANQTYVPPSPVAIANTDLTGGPQSGGGNDAGADLGSDGQASSNTRGNAANIETGNNLNVTPNTASAATPYDFASELSALRAAKGGNTGLPSPVDQVVLQMSRGLSKDGSGQMTIQLRPAELGRIDVKLNIGSDGKVQGTVTADNPTTLGLLLKDVRSLERALQEAGLRADSGSLQFNLRGDGQSGGTFGQQAGNSSGNGNNGGNNSPLTSTLAVPTADVLDTYYLTPGGVNMRV